MMTLSGIIDWFIPGDIRCDPERYRRARLVVGGTLFMGVLVVGVRAMRLFAGAGDEMISVAMLASAAILCTPLVLKWGRNLSLAAAIPVCVPLLVFPWAALGSGGLGAPILMAMPVVPVLSTFLLGARVGVASAVTVIAEVSVLGGMHARGYAFEQLIPEDRLYLFEMCTGVIGVMVTVFLTWLYERERLQVERKLREEIAERKRAERAKDDFVATVSHELRTPLTAIRGAVELLTGGVSDPSEGTARDLLQIAARNTRRLSTLVDDLLDMRAIEEGKLTLTLLPMDLARLVREAVDINQSLAQAHDTEFRIVGDLPEASVRGDRNRMLQILCNLLSNAAKYTMPGTVVTVALERLQKTVRISVTDRGPGIPASFQDRVFERFAQADSSSARAQGGTGLGLHITQALVHAHRGEVGFHTQAGVGTTFHVDLPVYSRVEHMLSVISPQGT